MKRISPWRERLTEHPPGQLCKFSTNAFVYKWFKNHTASSGIFKTMI